MADISLVIAPLAPSDRAGIERLDERCFGPGRFTRTAYRLREGVEPLPDLSFVARVGSLLVGANIITAIRCGDEPGLLLGPLTVDPAFRSRGIGEELVRRSLEAARRAGHGVILLVGDEPYYGKLGFKRAPRGRLTMPGPVDPARLLACELRAGALEAAKGRVKRSFATPAAA
jgi:predicted N-acetyltransferase YhbS